MTIKAYYTSIDSGEPFERFSRTGPFADIAVCVDDGDTRLGRLVFHRKTGYLPFWECDTGTYPVEEIVPRCGDGDGVRPDRVNAHSHVRLIEHDATHAVVHWRYVPCFGGTNPHKGLTAYGFVDEYFHIEADGKVRRTVRQGTESIVAWDGGVGVIEQHFVLGPEGIAAVAIETLCGTVVPLRTAAVPIREWTGPAPVLVLSFDEAKGPTTREAVSGRDLSIAGPRPYWKSGVSGTALQFDGYTTELVLPADAAPRIGNALTVEAWVALGANPWNWTPLVQQGDDNGYFLGIDGRGRPGFRFCVHGGLMECVSGQALERYRWHHVAGRFDGGRGVAELLVDGGVAARCSFAPGVIDTVDEDIRIGKGAPRRPADAVRASTFPSEYGVDGILDEIRIYDGVLSDEDLVAHAMPPEGEAALATRALPQLSGSTFSACYTRLPFYETWDNLGRVGEHADIVVGFDRHPTHFVFWRAMSYIPMLSNEKGQWYSNEFNETWSTSGGLGCQEPMSDKQNHFSHVRLIENTPARKVVHWRFALENVEKIVANFDEKTGWGDYSDWYYFIYPDGMAVKTMHLWTHGLINHEWQESMAIFGPNQHPEDIIDKERALTLLDLEGNRKEYDWRNGPPANIDEPIDKCIQYVHYKGDYHPVTIVPALARYDVYGGELTDYSVFPTWNHWPVAQIISDGRYASAPDRAAHSSLTHFIPAPLRHGLGDAPWQERVIMEGMTRLPPEELIPLAKSWIQPPRVLWARTCTYLGYEQGQRAYLFRFEKGDISFHLQASERSPVRNLCLVIKNWVGEEHATVRIDGQTVPAGDTHRQGVVTDTDGRPTLVIWLDMAGTETYEFKITPDYSE